MLAVDLQCTLCRLCAAYSVHSGLNVLHYKGCQIIQRQQLHACEYPNNMQHCRCRGPEINRPVVVGTLGKLTSWHEKIMLDLSAVKVAVFEEADQMFDVSPHSVKYPV